jgi:hypothetical protein
MASGHPQVNPRLGQPRTLTALQIYTRAYGKGWPWTPSCIARARNGRFRGVPPASYINSTPSDTPRRAPMNLYF